MIYSSKLLEEQLIHDFSKNKTLQESVDTLSLYIEDPHNHDGVDYEMLTESTTLVAMQIIAPMLKKSIAKAQARPADILDKYLEIGGWLLIFLTLLFKNKPHRTRVMFATIGGFLTGFMSCYIKLFNTMKALSVANVKNMLGAVVFTVLTTIVLKIVDFVMVKVTPKIIDKMLYPSTLRMAYRVSIDCNMGFMVSYIVGFQASVLWIKTQHPNKTASIRNIIHSVPFARGIAIVLARKVLFNKESLIDICHETMQQWAIRMQSPGKVLPTPQIQINDITPTYTNSLPENAMVARYTKGELNVMRGRISPDVEQCIIASITRLRNGIIRKTGMNTLDRSGVKIYYFDGLGLSSLVPSQEAKRNTLYLTNAYTDNIDIYMFIMSPTGLNESINNVDEASNIITGVLAHEMCHILVQTPHYLGDKFAIELAFHTMARDVSVGAAIMAAAISYMLFVQTRQLEYEVDQLASELVGYSSVETNRYILKHIKKGSTLSPHGRTDVRLDGLIKYYEKNVRIQNRTR